MPLPVLYVFSLSHYCEKARWALDRQGISYRLRTLMPGLHRRVAARLDLARSSTPFLATDTGAISASAAIIDWADAHRAIGRPDLEGDEPAEVRAIEARLDQVTGIHARRMYYSEALIKDAVSVRQIFMRGLPLRERLLQHLGWAKIVPMMIAGMDLGPAQGAESQAVLAGELDWLDTLLADGRNYLSGKRFSRADLTAASLLAPLVNPPEHPTYSELYVPPMLAAQLDKWRTRPILEWVLRIYAKERTNSQA